MSYKFYKFGYCKLKDNCPKVHVTEECGVGLQCKDVKTCSLRHPKMCKRIGLEGICFYKEKCAYNHKKIVHVQTVNNDAIQEDVKNLKTKVEFLKSTINSLVSIREECNIIENSVKDIKKEIKMLMTKNKEVEIRNKLIEDDLTDESEDESDRMEGQQTFKGHVKKTDLKLRYSKCECYTKSEVQLKKT